jgi:alpha-tubulin suppressor-like RCC1 family protein
MGWRWMKVKLPPAAIVHREDRRRKGTIKVKHAASSLAALSLFVLLAGCSQRTLIPAYHTPLPRTAVPSPSVPSQDFTQSNELIPSPSRTNPSFRSGVASVPLSAGGDHTCLITEAGAIRCWGGNEFGQLGNGTTGRASLLVEASGIPGGAVSVEAGVNHTCALDSEGGVWCWGDNDKGQLGDGTAETRTAPVRVAGLEVGAVMLAAGDSFTCALTDAGGVKCWGWNIRGQLGDGTFEDRPLPTDVSGLAVGVKAVAAGDEHACALLESGKVRCWGLGSEGQLGTGQRQVSNLPVEAAGGPPDVAEISAGGSYTCVVTVGGKVMCWGQMGSQWSGSDTLLPMEVRGFHDQPDSVEVGSHFTCALGAAGGVECWGSNSMGQLGDGTNRDSRNNPVEVAGLRDASIRLTAGAAHACALLQSGGLKCWGDNFFWQLGTKHPNSSSDPVGVDPDEVHYFYSGIEAAAPPAGYPQQYTSLWTLTEGFQDLRAPGINTYAAVVPRDRPWGWDFYLCGKDDAWLERMLTRVAVSFIIDHAQVAGEAILIFRSNNNSWSCQGRVTTLSGWENGKSELSILSEWKENASDGERAYAAGKYWQIIMADVVGAAP